MRTTLETVRRGLDPTLLPMRLWQKAKVLGVWNPSDIDLARDVDDWRRLDDGQRDLLLRLTAQFQAGEESVAYDLLPLLQVAADEQRIEEEMFLASYLWEEAKHVEGFSRFLREVAGVDGGLDHYLPPSYRRIFYVEQPRALDRLRSDRSPEALAEASVTYQMITEGVLAETGYYAYRSVLERNDLMPGMQELIGNIQRDESRHIAYGVWLLSRLVAEHGDPIWERIEARLGELVPVALESIGETLDPYGDDVPFGVEADDYVAFASTQASKRLATIERARRLDPDEVMRGESIDAAG